MTNFGEHLKNLLTLIITTVIACLVIIVIEYLVYGCYTSNTVRALEQGVMAAGIHEHFFGEKGE